MAKHKLRADRRISLTIELLEALSAAHNQQLSVSAFAREYNLSADDVRELVALAATLSDRNSGARAAITLDGDTVALEGAAAALSPTRLSAGEGAVLAYTLDLLELDDDCRRRIEAALMPFGLGVKTLSSVSSSLNVGSFYQTLSAAIADGVRCIISYRSARESEARQRTIDPLGFETAGSAAYLRAWDIDADAPRRYRLDRIARVATTEDSVTVHQADPETLTDSLSEHGEIVELSMPVDIARNLDWQGIVSQTNTGERAIVTVAVTSHTWLFDQLLSLGHGARIEQNPELRREFRAYAASLVIDQS